MIKNKIRILTYFFVIFILISCASGYVPYPEGGPKDITGPKILEAFPANNSANVDKDIDVEIKFDEFFDYSTTKNAITISPLGLKDNFNIIWYEKSVKIDFFDLPEDQTVIININRNLKDINRNRLSEVYNLSFSTGSSLDSSFIEGKIEKGIYDDMLYDYTNKSIKVLLYKKNEIEDSGFVNAEPFYSTGTDSSGFFKFKNLKKGEYFSLALLDNNNNNRLDILNNEPFSFGKGFVETDKNRKFKYYLSVSDTTRPFIKNISAVNKDLLKIVFSEDVFFSQEPVKYLLRDSISILKDYYINNSTLSELYIKTDTLSEGEELVIGFNPYKDNFNNSVSEGLLKKRTFISVEPDTSGLKIINRVLPAYSVSDTLDLFFNNFIDNNTSVKILSNDSLKTEYKHLKKNYNKMRIKVPLNELKISHDQYWLLVKHNTDTIHYNYFKVTEGYGTGKFTASVVSKEKDLFYNIYYAGNNKLALKNKINNNNIQLDLKPDKYIILFYKDKIIDKHYTSGNINPFEFAETVTIHKDTILIRKNWESSIGPVKL